MDDDDALGRWFIDDLRRQAAAENAGKIVTFEHGVYLGRSAAGFALHEHRYRKIGLGLSLIVGPGDGRTILDAGLHTSVDQRFDMLVESRPQSWLRSIHGRSDSGVEGVPRPRRKPVTVEDAAAELRESFPALDLRAVHDAYVRADPAAAQGSPAVARAAEAVIVGLVRFSILPRRNLAAWRLTRGLTIEEAAERVFDPERMEARFQLFEQVTLPSLDAQTGPPFHVVVLTSTLLPPAMWARLVRLTRGRPYLKLRRARPAKGLGLMAREALIQLRPDPSVPAATFRLDDDDALNRHFIADLHRLATPENAGKVVTFPDGVYLRRANDRFDLREINYPHIGLGLSLVVGAGDERTIFATGNHAKVGHRFEVLVEPRAQAWLRSIHGRSDSGARARPGTERPLMTAAEVAAELRGAYPTIDFAAVHAAYALAEKRTEVDGTDVVALVSVRSSDLQPK